MADEFDLLTSEDLMGVGALGTVARKDHGERFGISAKALGAVRAKVREKLAAAATADLTPLGLAKYRRKVGEDAFAQDLAKLRQTVAAYDQQVRYAEEGVPKDLGAVGPGREALVLKGFEGRVPLELASSIHAHASRGDARARELVAVLVALPPITLEKYGLRESDVTKARTAFEQAAFAPQLERVDAAKQARALHISNIATVAKQITSLTGAADPEADGGLTAMAGR